MNIIRREHIDLYLAKGTTVANPRHPIHRLRVERLHRTLFDAPDAIDAIHESVPWVVYWRGIIPHYFSVVSITPDVHIVYTSDTLGTVKAYRLYAPTLQYMDIYNRYRHYMTNPTQLSLTDIQLLNGTIEGFITSVRNCIDTPSLTLEGLIRLLRAHDIPLGDVSNK